MTTETQEIMETQLEINTIQPEQPAQPTPTDNPIETKQENESVNLIVNDENVPANKFISAHAQSYIDNYGFNPAAFCWNWWLVDEKGNEIEQGNEEYIPVNIPQLQTEFHFNFSLDQNTLIQMIQTENSGPSICSEKTPIGKLPEVWRLVKYPAPTWQVIDDDLNAWNEFIEMDVNGDGLISEEECRNFWTRKGKTVEEIAKIIAQLDSADLADAELDKDKVVDFYEFKTKFFAKKDLKFFNDDFMVRMSQYLFVILLPILCLIILYFNPDVHISVLIGASIQVMYMVYFTTLGYYFWNGTVVKEDASDTTYLYRVFSHPGKAEIYEGKWAPLSMTINQVAWPLKPIHSVSEFSAVDGAMPAVMLSNIGQYTWSMVTMHFMIQIVFNPDFTWGVSDTCQIIGVAGLVMLGVFEADPENNSVNKFHQIGALLGFGTVTGYIIQQLNENVDENQALSWILAILFIVFYTLWNMVLSICYFEEAKSWGIYDEEHIQDVEEKVRKENEHIDQEDDDVEYEDDDESCDSCGCICFFIFIACCAGICIIAGVPLLIFLVYGPIQMYKTIKHKKKVKAQMKKKDEQVILFDFQPALPNWEYYVTPQIKRKISTFSVANVMFEGVVLLVGSTALSLWLMGYERECEGFCFEQFFMLVFLSMVSLFGVIGAYTLLGVFDSERFNGVFNIYD